MGRLSTLFSPSSVAIVGATDRSGAVGRAVFENLRNDFDGTVVPINPSRETVLGSDCYPNLETAPTVDLVVVAVPPESAIDVVRTAGELGIEHVVVITAGFGETGPEGDTREQELIEIADKYDLQLIGPNSLGIMSTSVGLNASFGPTSPEPGSISFMSQSGAFVTAAVDWATQQGIGFNDIVSLGNKAVVDETDLIDTWGADPDTDVIIGYLEGIDRGRAFIETARQVTKDTPILLIKAGQTDAGARAAASHTGTIAGSEQAYEAALDQAGVIRATTVQELFDYARALTGLPTLDQPEIAVVTNAGGPGVMSADAIEHGQLSLAAFSESTRTALKELLPSGANLHNPVDIIGDADVKRFTRAIELALADQGVGGVIVMAAPTAILEYDDLAEEVGRLQQEYGKPVVGCFMGGAAADRGGDRLREYGIPNYFDPGRAADSLQALDRVRTIQMRDYQSVTQFSDVDSDQVSDILSMAGQRSGQRLGVEAMDILEAYGIPIPNSEIVDSPEQARSVANSIDGPVVMKIVSPDIVHKSDIGGVETDVVSSQAADIYETLLTRAKNYQPDATILGVQVQEQLDLADATELIIGTKHDPQFGQLVLVGLGGIFVEVFRDTTVRVGPVSQREAQSMLTELQAAPLFRGARGRPPGDEERLIETIQRLSQLVEDFPAILELDVNPLVVHPDGVTAIDVRLTVDSDQP